MQARFPEGFTGICVQYYRIYRYSVYQLKPLEKHWGRSIIVFSVERGNFAVCNRFPKGSKKSEGKKSSKVTQIFILSFSLIISRLSQRKITFSMSFLSFRFKSKFFFSFRIFFSGIIINCLILKCIILLKKPKCELFTNTWFVKNTADKKYTALYSSLYERRFQF